MVGSRELKDMWRGVGERGEASAALAGIWRKGWRTLANRRSHFIRAHPPCRPESTCTFPGVQGDVPRLLPCEFIAQPPHSSTRRTTWHPSLEKTRPRLTLSSKCWFAFKCESREQFAGTWLGWGAPPYWRSSDFISESKNNHFGAPMSALRKTSPIHRMEVGKR